MNRNIKRKYGFTIIEIAVVLVIIGLIIGGVIGGKELIRSAQLNSIIGQYKQYATAANTFKETYQYLAGDFPKATYYWPSGTGGPGAPADTCVSTGFFYNNTCAGDGDGTLKNKVLNPNTTYSYYTYEQNLFWTHLQFANLLPVTFAPGTVRMATRPFSTGLSANQAGPDGKIGQSKWMADTWIYNSGGAIGYTNPIQSTVPASYFALGSGTDAIDSYGNVLVLGTQKSVSGMGITRYFPLGPVLTPSEMYEIDSKADDGKPGAGMIVVYSNGGVANCTTTSDYTDLTADYQLSGTAATTVSCAPIFRNAF